MFVFLSFQAGVEYQKEFAGGCFGDDLPIYFFFGAYHYGFLYISQ